MKADLPSARRLLSPVLLALFGGTYKGATGGWQESVGALDPADDDA